MKKLTPKVIEFLDQSNRIEGVYSKEALLDAEKAWRFLIEQPKLDVATVLMTHEILMANQDLNEDEIGFFRRVPVWIGGHEGISSLLVPEAIDSWLGDVETSIRIPGENGVNIKLDHIEYERIHPFIDGNGRTGRMFLNYERVKVGLPILVIHEGEEQMEYYKWFRK